MTWTIESLIRLILVLAVVTWISFSIYVIVPKLPESALITALTAIIGILSTTFGFLQYREGKIQELELKSKNEKL